jgi:hypothetical protein
MDDRRRKGQERGHAPRAADGDGSRSVCIGGCRQQNLCCLSINATVHDLRRTVGTNLARLGISKDIRARLLNHVEGARSVTDAVYNQHEFWHKKRAALELWERDLKRIIGL